MVNKGKGKRKGKNKGKGKTKEDKTGHISPNCPHKKGKGGKSKTGGPHKGQWYDGKGYGQPLLWLSAAGLQWLQWTAIEH
eukprot:2357371-Amphidinium_carterae.1